MQLLRTSLPLSPLLAVVLHATPATAMPVAYGTGLPDPATTIDFSGLADGTPIGATYAALGVTFSGLTATSQFGSTLGNTQAPAAANFASGQPTNAVFSISFATVVDDVEFFLSTDGYGTVITSTLGGAPVETVTAGQYATSGADYFGFTGSSFDGITISVANTGSAVIDNVELGETAVAQAVPEPGSSTSMLLGLAGLVGLGAARRRS